MSNKAFHKRIKAFERLYFDYFPGLCALVFRFVRNEEVAKDIVQEIFLKYWKTEGSIKIRESEFSYLKRACINEALNHIKAYEKRSQRELDFAVEINSPSGNGPLEDLISKETSKTIDYTISALPSSCRTAFLLSRYEYKSYREIAQIMGITVNTVEKHIGKALKQLRARLKKSDE